MGKSKAFAIKYIDEYNIIDCEKLLLDSKLSQEEAKTIISQIKADGRRDVAVEKGGLSKDQVNNLLEILNKQTLEIKLCQQKKALRVSLN